LALGSGGQDLEEVVVTADRAVMELGLDRKVFNVEKSVAAAGGNAEDLLRQLPSVDVDLDGNVSLRGSGNVRFLINGRPSGLVGTDPVTFLRSLSANNVARIEVITNPGAAYDPDGTAGLINIVLKRKRDDGFNSTLNLNFGSAPSFDGSLDMNWRKGKFNSFAGIAGRYDNRFFRGFRDQEGTIADSTFQRNFTFNGDRLRQSSTFRAGTEYSLSEQTIVGIQGSLQLESGESTNTRVTRFRDGEGQLARTSFRDEFEPEEEDNLEFEANFTTNFKKEGRKLSGSAQWSRNDELETENYNERIIDPEGNVLETFLQRAPSLEDRTRIQLQMDYEQQMGDLKFETGWRTTLQDLTTEAAFGDVDPSSETFLPVDSLSNLFNYREDVHAVYATFGGKLDNIVFSAGLRAEQAFTTSTLLEPSFEEFENDYFKVYPS
ncbi:MAG: TonB-dependent receptor, partial [Bacteroidota bacterium]